MANIDNINREALREAFTRYIHNDPLKNTSFSRAWSGMNSHMFSQGKSVLELDPLVKYRFAGQDAIDDLDMSGAVNGNPDRTWSNSRYHTPFFTQGSPYWSIGEMVSRGDGTSRGISPSNPFLIGTYGNNWLSSASGEDLELSDEDLDHSAIKKLAKQRGLTPEKIEILEDFSSQYKQLLKEIGNIHGSIEKRGIAHRKSLGKKPLTAQDFLETTVKIPEIDGLIKKHKELTKQINQFGPELATHILGDSKKGILPWSQQFGGGGNLALQSVKDYLSMAKTMDDVFPSKIQEFKKPLLERTSFSKDFLRRYPDMAISPLWKTYSPDFQKLYKLGNSIEANREGIKTVQETTELEPLEFGLVQNSDESFSLPPTIKTGSKNKDPFYLDVSSDEPLFAKIKDGKASSAEISQAFGLKALGTQASHWNIGEERLDAMAYPNDRIETMPSILIPKKDNRKPFKIPASSVQLANRPFAVWEWVNGQFNLVNEGNNKSMGGSKPIPTANIPRVGPYPDFDTQTVNELFGKYTRKGMVSADLLTAPIKPFVSVAQGLAEKDEFLEIMQKGFSSPKTAANFANNYIQNPATRGMVNAEMGASALKFAGKAATAAAVGLTPFDALNRRDRNFTDFYQTTGRDPTYEENMVLRIKSGLEPALNLATFGAYDALAETPTYRAYLDQEQRDRAPAMERQRSIDYPVISGYQTERTTK